VTRGGPSGIGLGLMKAMLLVLGALLPAAEWGCDRKGDAPRTADQPSPSASVISIGVEMGACPDMVACANECDAGSADRCRRLGVTYEFGKGVERDGVHATELYVRGCDMRDSESCLAAGRMYEFHHGVDKDDTKAVGFYKRACDSGNTTGCANLAIMLESGQGTPKDEVRAIELFDQACTRGSGLACQHASALRTKRAPPP
jgi:TPR repeat protein